MNRRLRPAFRWVVAAAVVALLVVQFGADGVAAGFARVGSAEMLIASGIGLAATACCAARWCLIARRTGCELRFGPALAEYYRAQLLNSVLPAGVVGDAHRGIRFGRLTGNVARGVRTVVYERLAGQVALLILGTVALIGHPQLRRIFAELATKNAALVVVAGMLLVAVVAVAAGTERVRALRAEISSALTGTGALVVLVLSVLAVAGHLVVFVVAARAVDDTAPVADMFPLAVLALVAMSLPIGVGGWGPREAACAAGFAAAGFGAAHGVAAAVVFGVLGLVACTPGLVVLPADAVGKRERMGPAVPGDEGEQHQQDGGHDRAAGRAHRELGDDRTDHHGGQAQRREAAQQRDQQADRAGELDPTGQVPEPVAEADAIERLGDVGVATQHG